MLRTIVKVAAVFLIETGLASLGVPPAYLIISGLALLMVLYWRDIKALRLGALLASKPQEPPLKVRIYGGWCAKNVATFYVQVMNTSPQDAVWLTFSLGLSGSRDRWKQVDTRSLHDGEGIVGPIPSDGELRDPGVTDKLPDHFRLGPLEDRQGWITFEYSEIERWAGVQTFTLTEENVRRLVLSVRDDATERVLDKPLW